MHAIWVPILAVIFLLLQIGMLVLCIKQKCRFRFLFSVELISLAAACVGIDIFDALPGFGFMPGLTYLGVWLCCLCAAITYGVMLAASTAVWWLHHRKHPKRGA